MKTPSAPLVRHGQAVANARPLQWTTELVQKFWDYQSNFPQAYFTTQFGIQIADTVQKLIPPHSRILDYACGTGALTGHLLDAGMSVAACDLSPDSLHVVRGKYEKRKGFLGSYSIDELPSSGLQFDAIVLVEIVEHVNDGILHRIFGDVKQILSPGGLVIVTTPNDEDLSIDTVYCPCCEHTFHRWQHVRSWSAATLADMFSSQGLEPVSSLTTDFSLSPKAGLLRYWARRLFNRVGKRRAPHLIGVARRAH